MKSSKGMRIRGAGWLVLGVLALAGCTGSDPIVSGNALVTFRIEGNPAGAGRYETANLVITLIEVRPVDPTAIAVIGNSPIRLNGGNVTANLVNAATDAPRVGLVPGTYQVVLLDILSLSLTDSDPPAAPANCIENLAAVPGTSGLGSGTWSFNASDLNLTFTVSAGQSSVVALEIDGPALTSLYESSFTCTLGGACGDPACLTGFDRPAFTAGVPALVGIEVR